MIRKLNEELKLREGKEANAKVMIGKMRVIEKLAHEWENKCRELEKTNKKLSGELESLTKVLEARGKWNEQQGLLNIDKQSDGTMTTLPAVTTNTMSQADRQLLEECSTLVEGIAAGRANCGEFLIRKISGILREYSTSRESVLSCSDFLVQMM